MLAERMNAEEIVRMFFVLNNRLTTREVKTIATNEQLRKAYAKLARQLSRPIKQLVNAIADTEIDINSKPQIDQFKSDSYEIAETGKAFQEIGGRINKLMGEAIGVYTGDVETLAEKFADHRYGKDVLQLIEIRTGGVVSDPLLQEAFEFLPETAKQPLPKPQAIRPAA